VALKEELDFYFSILLTLLTIIKTLYQILFIPLITMGVFSLLYGIIKQKNKKFLILGIVCISVIFILFLIYTASGQFFGMFKSVGGTWETSCFPDINSNCSFNQICCTKLNEKTDCCCEGNGLICYVSEEN